MSVTVPAVDLGNRYARELPELVVAWSAKEHPDARALVVNDRVATDLGLDPQWLRTDAGVRFLLGTAVPDGATPVAQGYAGNQFGAPLARLGDGRALLLGELTGPDGREVDLHLKGSGRTPFARGGDGLAAVGPMVREYVISEAMHALGIPTTRTLAVVATGELIARETYQPGAVLTRTASSHLRVGTFQYAAASGDVDLLRRLADHAIDRHYPEARGDERPYLAFLRSVVAAQADLVARWMLVGFIHGVMNTDNMTISGETIDYGPCAFMDAYDPATVYSSIDEGGRYAYGRQPVIAQWNLCRLAETLLPLIADDQEQAVADATAVLDAFPQQYREVWTAGMHAKLGLDSDDQQLVDDLLSLLRDNHVDWTSFFRDPAASRDDFLDLAGIDAWLERWRAHDPDLEAMRRVNPVYIPRNHLVEEALAAAVADDLGPLGTLVEAITAPYVERPGFERFAAPAPKDFGADYQTFCGT